MKYTAATLTALLGAAQAVDVQVVSVGRNPVNNATGLKFWPENIKAEPGTMVQFQFWAGNHTVTQSNFDNPCAPMESSNGTAVDSSFQPVAASADKNEVPVFTIMVNDKKPMWLYCAQGPHCEKGMAMVINENTGANSTRSLENYKSLAAGSAPEGSNPGDSNSGGSNPGESSPGGETGGNNGNTGGNEETGSTPTGGSESPAGSESGAPGSSTSQPATAGASAATISSSILLGVSALFMML